MDGWGEGWKGGSLELPQICFNSILKTHSQQPFEQETTSEAAKGKFPGQRTVTALGTADMCWSKRGGLKAVGVYVLKV